MPTASQSSISLLATTAAVMGGIIWASARRTRARTERYKAVLEDAYDDAYIAGYMLGVQDRRRARTR